MGICSRREADRLIEAGRVKIDGRLAKMGENVEGENQVYVDEKRVGQESDIKKVKPILIAVNKPVGIVCTTSTKDRVFSANLSHWATGQGLQGIDFNDQSGRFSQ